MSGRIRTIKPEVLEDEIATSLSDSAWRLWVSLWVLADDHGNVRLGARYIAAQVWQDTSRDVSGPLQELVTKGRVTPYAVHGQRYGHISGWGAHQRIDNAGKPRVPTPEEDDGTWNQVDSGVFAASRGDSQRVAEILCESRLDLRPPTSEGEGDTSGVAVATPPPPRKAKSAKGTRISEDWEPAPGLVERLRRELRVDPMPSLRRFRNHFVAMTDRNRNAFKTRWDLAFENWVERDAAEGKLPPLDDEPTPPIHRAPGREEHMPANDADAGLFAGVKR